MDNIGLSGLALQISSPNCLVIKLHRQLRNLLVFHKKRPHEARAKPCSVFKFSDNLSALSQMYPLQMRLQVRLTFGQMVLPEWGFRSGWPLVRLQVRLTFHQMYPQDEALGQIDIWTDFRSGWPLVRCTPRMRFWVRLTFGHFRLGWPLVRCTPRMRLWVWLTFGQMYPPRWGFESGWPLVRCTPSQRHLVAKCNTTASQSGASSHGNSTSISVY